MGGKFQEKWKLMKSRINNLLFIPLYLKSTDWASQTRKVSTEFPGVFGPVFHERRAHQERTLHVTPKMQQQLNIRNTKWDTSRTRRSLLGMILDFYLK